MPTRSSAERKLQAAERLLDRYRAAVREMMTAKYDLELTAAHLKRTGVSREQAQHCDTMARELRWRLMPFCAVEPELFDKLETEMQAEYKRRDAFNAHVHEAKARARPKNGRREGNDGE